MIICGYAESQNNDILWVLKNSPFVPNSQNWGDRKCLPDPRRSIVGLPDAIFFLRISREGVFQQPRLFTSNSLGCGKLVMDGLAGWTVKNNGRIGISNTSKA